MAKTEVTKSSETTPPRPRDIFSAMRDEMDRVFERFEHSLPRWPALFRREGPLPCRSSTWVRTPTLSSEAEFPGVDDKDVSVTLVNGMLTIKGEKKHDKEKRARTITSPSAASSAPRYDRRGQGRGQVRQGRVKVTAAKKLEAVKAERKIEIKKA